MPKSNISVQHSLPQAEALRRIKDVLPSIMAKHEGKFSDLKQNWTNNGGTFSLKALRFSVKGALNVTGSNAQLSVDLPLAALPVKGKIERNIREEAEKALKTP